MTDLQGKVVLITGGGTGVGAAVAERMAAAGAQVVIVGRREEPLRRTAESIGAGPSVQVEIADVTDRTQVAQLVERVSDSVGPIDILVNNAGVNIPERRLAQLTPENWDYLMDVNATGAFNVVHAVLPQMRERRDGLIISISSISGIRPSALAGAAYSASKHALAALTKVIGLEDGDNNIRATLISPGDIDTPLLEKRPVKVSEEIRAIILQPDDVAAAVLFVATLPARACVPEMVIKPTVGHPFA
jgi:NADP-dependent 3-hydroxy acid dehydrogenase YdfG